MNIYHRLVKSKYRTLRSLSSGEDVPTPMLPAESMECGFRLQYVSDTDSVVLTPGKPAAMCCVLGPPTSPVFCKVARSTVVIASADMQTFLWISSADADLVR